MTLSLDGWKGVSVGSTTHTLPVLPRKAGPKPEPVAGNLLASLAHPDRKSNLLTVAFSPDGKRLFASGYPSGVVQFWDVASRKELTRIATPSGLRSSADYAILDADWKTMYVPVHRRTISAAERDGKKSYRIDYSGQVRVWDVASGKEKEPIPSSPDTGPINVKVVPGGRTLIVTEMAGYDTAASRPKAEAVAVDLATGKKSRLYPTSATPVFTPDGKSAVVGINDQQAKTLTVKLLNPATGKEVASARVGEPGQSLVVGSISPDGSVVAVHLGGKKGGPMEVQFFDTKSLARRGTLTGKADPDGYGWGNGAFAPDGKRYVALDQSGTLMLWDVAEKKLAKTVPIPGAGTGRLAVSPDGKLAAVGWVPLPKDVRELGRNPDPRDLAQPRLALIDLAGKSEPRVLIARHGYSGGVAFSPNGKLLAFGGAGAVHLFDLSK